MIVFVAGQPIELDSHILEFVETYQSWPRWRRFIWRHAGR